MEISEIEDAFAKLEIATSDPTMTSILNETCEQELAVLMSPKSEFISAAHFKLHALSMGLKIVGKDARVDLLATYVRAMHEILGLAITEASVKKLFAFLFANGYFSILFHYYFDASPKYGSCKQPLLQAILRFLPLVKIQLGTQPGVPYNESKMVFDAEQAILSNNISGVYTLIEAMERSSRGLHWNFLAERLTDFLFYLDRDGFVRHLHTLSEPYTIAWYLQNLDKPALEFVTGKSIVQNWTAFELIRLMNNKLGDAYNPAQRQIIGSQLIQCFEWDPAFFKQVILYFKGSKLVLSALGSVCGMLPTQNINELFEKWLPLDRYHTRLAAHEELLKNLDTGEDETKLKDILEYIHGIWEEFVSRLLKDEDYFQSDLLLTDFANYIVAYYKLYSTDEAIVGKMKGFINALNDLDWEWFVSFSKKQTKYYWYSSMLYLLSLTYKNKGLNVPEIRKGIEDLNNDRMAHARYDTKNAKLGMEDIYKNVI